MGTFRGEAASLLPGARRGFGRTAAALAALVAAAALLAVLLVSSTEQGTALLSGLTPRMIGESKVLTQAEINAMHPNARNERMRESASQSENYDEGALKNFHSAPLTPSQAAALHGRGATPMQISSLRRRRAVATHPVQQLAAAPSRPIGSFSRRQLNALLGKKPSYRPAKEVAAAPSRHIGSFSRIELNALLGKKSSYRPAKEVAEAPWDPSLGLSRGELNALHRRPRKVVDLKQAAATQQLAQVPQPELALVPYTGGQMLAVQMLIPDWSGLGKGDFDTGVTPRQDDHTIFCALRWSSQYADRRQWVLNFGQWNSFAEHWLWNGDDKIQFGMWGGAQIESAPMKGSSVLATVKQGGTYTLYLDGEVVGTVANYLDIQSSTMHVGQQPPGWGESDYMGAIFETQLFMEGLDSDAVASQSLALMEKYADVPDWSQMGKGKFDTGLSAPGTQDHTIMMALKWDTKSWGGSRQWILDFGQQGSGGENWLWNGGEKVQFGAWSGAQIESAKMQGSSVLATVKEGEVYKLYLDGELASTLNPEP
jgi:hypothetical protein